MVPENAPFDLLNFYKISLFLLLEQHGNADFPVAGLFFCNRMRIMIPIRVHGMRFLL